MGCRIVLLAGTSHVGKSTLATRLADALGCVVISTDRLARHPGRPWPSIPRPVIEYYERLTPETIYWFLRAHHENMWPALKQIIDDQKLTEGALVLEGSALRPEYIAPLLSDTVIGLCLHAPEAFLRERMQVEAGYSEASDADRLVMDKFIGRSLRDNAEMHDSAVDHGLTLVDASQRGTVENLYRRLVDDIRAAAP
jgi:2-phosphoglycerate kinase